MGSFDLFGWHLTSLRMTGGCGRWRGSGENLFELGVELAGMGSFDLFGWRLTSLRMTGGWGLAGAHFSEVLKPAP